MKNGDIINPENSTVNPGLPGKGCFRHPPLPLYRGRGGVLYCFRKEIHRRARRNQKHTEGYHGDETLCSLEADE